MGEPVELEGEEVLPVFRYRVDPKTNELTPKTREEVEPYDRYFIKTRGDKVFILDKGGISGQRRWLLLYDFGLKPGEWTEVYNVYIQEFLPTKMKCVEIKRDPEYNDYLTMKLVPEYTVGGEEIALIDYHTSTWIVGIGCTRGLLFPAPLGYGGSYSTDEVTLHGELIFRNPSYQASPRLK